MTIEGPLDLGPWRDRLTEAVTVFRDVGLSAELLAAQESLRTTPAAFVVPISDNPASRPGTGNTIRSQNVNATVAVVLAVSNSRGSSSGSEASTDLQAIRRAVMDSLIGWQPPGADLGISYAGGRAFAFKDSTVWWTDRFLTSYFVRKEFS